MQCDIPESPDVTPPVVVVLFPYSGSVISGTITVSISATDERGVKRTWYYLDGEKMGESQSARPQFELDVSGIADDQVHVIYAAAEDESGNVGHSGQISVIISGSEDIVPPVARLIYPQVGQVLNGIVDVKVEASDDRQLDRVEFYIDGNLMSTIKAETSDSIFTYLWDTGSYARNSRHTLYFKAIDTAGNMSVNDAISFTIGLIDVTAPTVTLLYPLAGETLTGTVEVRVDANDDVGVVKVEFYIDGVLTNTDQSAPWAFSWNTNAWADGGNHTLYMKAFDAEQNLGTFGPVTFIIQ